ncbi:MAG TPA: peptidylprolyl isomerase [Gammaproteobacteria bacterium]|jgi:peptidyl-prolyl cis-trans isomerase A (cyclophilin A)|nr:peptidylprolyl isomerase [Gammaproteobacteria bacterium]
MLRKLAGSVLVAVGLVLSAALPAAAADQAKGGKPMVVFSTNYGDFTLELYPDKAPITVENFLSYVDSGFYDGTIFHRVIPGFVIQGGGFTEDMQQKRTQAPIKNEADNGLKNLRGTLSMARTSDINSATSQFFVNLKDNAFLDHGSRDFGYAVFAKVVDGMDVIDKIAAVPTGNRGGHQDVPREPVIVKSASRKQAE